MSSLDISSPSPPACPSPEEASARAVHRSKRRNKRSLMKMLHANDGRPDAKSDDEASPAPPPPPAAVSASELGLSPPASPHPTVSAHQCPLDIHSANLARAPPSAAELAEPPAANVPSSSSQEGAHRPQHRRARPYLYSPVVLPAPAPAPADSNSNPNASSSSNAALAPARYSSLSAWRTARAPIRVPAPALACLRALVYGPPPDASASASASPGPRWPPADRPMDWAGALCGGPAPALPAEPQEGSVEYKWRLLAVTRNKLTQLGTQMRSRMRAGAGRAVFVAGVADEGGNVGCSAADMLETLGVLYACASEGGACLRVEHVWRGAGGAPPRGRNWQWSSPDAARAAVVDGGEAAAAATGAGANSPPLGCRDTLVCVVTVTQAAMQSPEDGPAAASARCSCDGQLLNTRRMCPRHRHAEALEPPLALPTLLELVRAGLERDAADVLERRCTGVGVGLMENDRAWQSFVELNAWHRGAAEEGAVEEGEERSPAVAARDTLAAEGLDEEGSGGLLLDMQDMESSEEEESSDEEE